MFRGQGTEPIVEALGLPARGLAWARRLNMIGEFWKTGDPNIVP